MRQNLTQLDIGCLAILARLGQDAYGVSIHAALEAALGREVSMAAVYAALDRLDTQGLIQPWMSEPRPERGGRARKHYGLTPSGQRAVQFEQAVQERLWRGVRPDAELNRS